MPLQPVLVGGKWRDSSSPASYFAAIDPTCGETLPGEYPISSWSDVEAALVAATEAVAGLRPVQHDGVAAFLEAYATGIERRSAELVRTAHAETGLPEEPRLASAGCLFLRAPSDGILFFRLST